MLQIQDPPVQVHSRHSAMAIFPSSSQGSVGKKEWLMTSLLFLIKWAAWSRLSLFRITEPAVKRVLRIMTTLVRQKHIQAIRTFILVFPKFTWLCGFLRVWEPKLRNTHKAMGSLVCAVTSYLTPSSVCRLDPQSVQRRNTGWEARTSHRSGS